MAGALSFFGLHDRSKKMVKCHRKMCVQQFSCPISVKHGRTEGLGTVLRNVDK